MKMITTKQHRYGRPRGRPHALGAEFEVAKHDVRLVKALGWGVPAPVAEPTKPFVNVPFPPRIAEKVAEPASAAPQADPAPDDPAKPKRTYQRRDMKAED